MPDQKTTTPRIQAFTCWIDGYKDFTKTVYATSIGKAKSRYYHEALDWFPNVEYTWIRARNDGLSPPVTTDDFRRMADYRGIPFARIGMRVSVGGEAGTIVGHNSSSNLNVLFDADSRYSGEVLNCHPHSKVVYYDSDGAAINKELANA